MGLVTVMGLSMFGYGLNLSGVSFDLAESAFAATRQSGFRYGGGKSGPSAFQPVIENGVQVINSTLSAGRYPAITVVSGIPARWTITAPAGSINGCNNRMFIREYNIEHRFVQGENIIEFMPERA